MYVFLKSHSKIWSAKFFSVLPNSAPSWCGQPDACSSTIYDRIITSRQAQEVRVCAIAIPWTLTQGSNLLCRGEETPFVCNLGIQRIPSLFFIPLAISQSGLKTPKT